MKHVAEFVVQDTEFKGQENSGTALELIETIAEIVNSTFVSNRKGSYKCALVDPNNGCYRYGFIGGAIISTNSTIDIRRSKFETNGAEFAGAILAEQHSIINMCDIIIINNSAKTGGVLYSSNSTITIKASEFHDNSATDRGGVLFSDSSIITIEASEFHDNNATDRGGILYSDKSVITILASGFDDNSATDGGVLDLIGSIITIEASQFHDNSATDGGVLDSTKSVITIGASQFHNNSADFRGGVLNSISDTITIEACEFRDNSADRGGVLESYGSTITMETSEFHNNSAKIKGGVLDSYSSTFTIESSVFYNNSAKDKGGVLNPKNSTITIGDSNFTKNDSPLGAVIHAADSSKILYHNFLLIDNNSVDSYAVIYLSDSEFSGHESNNVTFSSNLGSLVAFNSNITFSGRAIFVNNQPPQTTMDNLQEGGAITLFQSNVFFDGGCNLEHNHAENGGAIHSTESKLYLNGNLTIAHNTATRNGGGVYLSTSELNCQQKSTFVLFNNSAGLNGGGLHAVGSSIKAASKVGAGYIGTRINFNRNAAKWGGGLSLEANAKLYILKYDWAYDDYNYLNNTNTTIFTANSADYGGAVYVDDDTNSGTCASDPKRECFFQILAIYDIDYFREDINSNTQSIYFSHNYANIAGSTLYGGLLDRCVVSQFAEHYEKYAHGTNDRSSEIAYLYFKSVSITTNISVSSGPVRVCLCTNNVHDCTQQSHIKLVKKGETFTVSLVAVDQIGQPVDATIQTSLNFAGSGLAEGQLARRVYAECNNLTFNVVSPHNSENLTLYASDGPCKDAEISRATVEIQFLTCSCPIGLQVLGMNKTSCTCECHRDISQYVEHCDSLTGLLIKQPQSRAWISYINYHNLTGYLVYPNCPFDFCLSTSPPIDLNKTNGADAQCAFNRSSRLCGYCQPGLSLSLCSSRCLLYVLATGLHYLWPST